MVESMVEVYYNSGQFKNTLVFLEKYFDDPFRMYEALGRFYEKKGYSEISHSRMRRYEILMEFAGEQKEIPSEALSDVMLLDLYLRENLKSRPSFASDQKPYERLIWDYRKAKKIPKTGGRGKPLPLSDSAVICLKRRRGGPMWPPVFHGQ